MTPVEPSGQLRIKMFKQEVDRLYDSGVTHPVAAVVSMTARSDAGFDVAHYSQEINVSVDDIEAIERGEVELGATLGRLGEGLPLDIDELLTSIFTR